MEIAEVGVVLVGVGGAAIAKVDPWVGRLEGRAERGVAVTAFHEDLHSHTLSGTLRSMRLPLSSSLVVVGACTAVCVKSTGPDTAACLAESQHLVWVENPLVLRCLDGELVVLRGKCPQHQDLVVARHKLGSGQKWGSAVRSAAFRRHTGRRGIT